MNKAAALAIALALLALPAAALAEPGDFLSEPPAGETVAEADRIDYVYTVRNDSDELVALRIYADAGLTVDVSSVSIKPSGEAASYSIIDGNDGFVLMSDLLHAGDELRFCATVCADAQTVVCHVSVDDEIKTISHVPQSAITDAPTAAAATDTDVRMTETDSRFFRIWSLVLCFMVVLIDNALLWKLRQIKDRRALLAQTEIDKKSDLPK